MEGVGSRLFWDGVFVGGKGDCSEALDRLSSSKPEKGHVGAQLPVLSATASSQPQRTGIPCWLQAWGHLGEEGPGLESP